MRIGLLGGRRTPFVKAGTALKRYRALELATHVVDGLIDGEALDPASVDALIQGIVVLEPRTPQFGREVAFASRLGPDVPAWTITDNCITGTSAIMAAHDDIAAGRAQVAIAAGVESMSNPPVLFSPQASRIFVDLANARTLQERLRLIGSLRPAHLRPDAPGVVEPSTGLSMGEHTELTVKEWKIGRIEQDELALRSHLRAAGATEDGRLKAEIVPLGDLDRDTIVRPDTSLEKLAKLRPVFDRSEVGTLTAGNSSPLTDGAAAVLVASESWARANDRQPLAYIKAYEKVALDPADGLLMGPGIAVPILLERTGLKLSDFDLIEMHEAFAGQVLSNLAAWEQGWKKEAIGTVDRDKLNVLGSSIAVGHPFSATGIRIATTLANEMARRDAKLGLISICAAGAMAAAMILERD